MSMVAATRTQQREKPASMQQKQPQATPEQLRLAQIINGSIRDEDMETQRSVEKIMEVTGTNEDNARTALYDTNNDTNRAIELILENGSYEQGSEWETAVRRKHKNSQNTSKGVDSLEDDIKDMSQQPSSRKERTDSKGRGRGRNNKNKSKNDAREKSTEDDGRGGYESRERQRGGRKGRGRGNSYSSRGRQPGRGPRRFGRFNRDRSDNMENPASGSRQNDFLDGFDTYANKNSDATNNNGPWGGDEDWDNLEVGTWSNDDTKKRNEKKKDSFSEHWGTDTWADDLTETKVFQSQTVQPAVPAGLPSPHASAQQHSVAKPQMGERIDIGSLFKKTTGASTDSSSSYSQQLGNSMAPSSLPYSSGSQHNPPSVIQQLQQQGQSSSLFSDNKPVVTDMDSSSRLFGSYDRQTSSSSTSAVPPIGHYSSVQGHGSEAAYSQFNGKLTTENNERGSSLLGSFGEQFKASETTVASGMLGQISDLTKSAFTPLKTGVPKSVAPPPGMNADYNTYAQTKQQEATEAVKASLGLPSTSGDQLETSATHSVLPSLTHSQSMSRGTLSFGEPLAIRQPKPQRRKQPSKIPASAVEMPSAGGGNFHELSNFDLQFGIDDGPSATGDFSSSSNVGAVTQSGLFTGSAVSSQGSLINHMPSGTIADSSMFTQQMSGQQTEARTIQRSSYQSLQQTEFSKSGGQIGGTQDSLTHSAQQSSDSTSVVMHGSQRFPEGKKPSEGPRRGPPGLTHPLASAASTANKQADLSASGSYASARIIAGANLPLSGLSAESTMDQTSVGNSSHSYYTSSSLGQQSQQQIGTDVQNSAGRSLRSPVPTTSLQGSLQASPMSHISAAPPKDGLQSGSVSTAMSSLASGLSQTHITPNVGTTPTKLPTTSTSAPLNIPGSSSSNSQISGSGTYGSMGMHLPYSASPSPAASSQASATPSVSSPNKHLGSDLYTSPGGLPSSLHHSHQQQQQSSTAVSTAIGSSTLGGGVMSSSAVSSKASASVNTASTKTGPPNLPLNVPPMLPNQFGIPVAPGLMTAYTPEAALYGYPDLSQMAVQSRMVNQMPNYYDVSSFHSTANPSANASSVNRESSSSNVNQGKFSHREPSSPTSVIGMMNATVGSSLAQQVAGQHNAQLKAVSQTGTHQAQPFVNLPAAHAAYPGYSGLYYNAFQYPPVFAAAAAAASAVPQGGKHSVSATTAFQQHGTGFANAYSTASVNASTASTLQDLQGQGYNKSHASLYEKQQAAFHHHTNTPPPTFNLQTLTAAMAAANTGGAGTGAAAPAMSPYAQTPFMTMLPHQHSQIHLHHVPQHGDVGQSVTSQRSQTSALGKSGAKPAFNSAQYWPN